MKTRLLAQLCFVALLGTLHEVSARAEDNISDEARKVVTSLLDQEERWLSGDERFSIDDVFAHYANDVVIVSSGKTHVGLGSVKKWWVSQVREFQKINENGLKLETKAKIESVQQFTNSTVLVTVKQTQYVSKGTNTSRSEYIGVYVLAREDGVLRVKLETVND